MYHMFNKKTSRFQSMFKSEISGASKLVKPSPTPNSIWTLLRYTIRRFSMFTSSTFSMCLRTRLSMTKGMPERKKRNRKNRLRNLPIFITLQLKNAKTENNRKNKIIIFVQIDSGIPLSMSDKNIRSTLSKT